MLTIDCGNTRLKWALFDGPRLLQDGALTLQELASLPRHLPQPLPQEVVVCNVAGERAAAEIRAAVDGGGRLIRWVKSQPSQYGIVNRYDAAQLGADRWAALIGARHLHPGPCLVVMAGTATTVDVLDGDGVFQGGLILPGLRLMQQSLARNTAQLAAAPGAFVPRPRTTADAIASGCLQAQLGAIERVFSGLSVGSLCLLSGGAAPVLAPHLQIPLRQEPHLVLHGLARIGAES